MVEYKKYRRTQIAEMADWVPGFPMDGVSVSDADREAGSPKAGDKIARNPANHADRWLVAAEYFAANFEPRERGGTGMTLDGLAFEGLVKAFFSTVKQRYPLTDAEVDAIREFRAESMLTKFPEMVWRAVLDAMLGHVDALRAENIERIRMTVDTSCRLPGVDVTEVG